MQSKSLDRSIKSAPTNRLLSIFFSIPLRNRYGCVNYYILFCDQTCMEKSSFPFKKLIVLCSLFIYFGKGIQNAYGFVIKNVIFIRSTYIK